MAKTKKFVNDTKRTFSLKTSTLAISIGLAAGGCGSSYAQQVALLDSGINPDRGFNVVGGFNYFNNTNDTSDVAEGEDGEEGHGTISARLVTESFSGEIVPFVVTNGDLSRDESVESMVRNARDSALSDILGRDNIKVIGITWGTDGMVNSAAPLMSDLVQEGKVIAIMSGNNFGAQPNTLSTSSFNLDGVIIVGATDADGVMLASSNRAGTTANKYVAAIGLPDNDGSPGGTSWAAARIAGIAGAVLLQNPDLTAQEVVDVILSSAEDRGEEGTDDEYGRGVILSAEQVLNNVMGPVTVPTTPAPPPADTGGGGGGGGAGIILIGGALAAALAMGRKSGTKLEKTLVLDSYGRTFQVDLNKHITINDETLHLLW